MYLPKLLSLSLNHSPIDVKFFIRVYSYLPLVSFIFILYYERECYVWNTHNCQAIRLLLLYFLCVIKDDQKRQLSKYFLIILFFRWLCCPPPPPAVTSKGWCVRAEEMTGDVFRPQQRLTRETPGAACLTIVSPTPAGHQVFTRSDWEWKKP